MDENLTLADIQMPFLEYRANFKEPITSIWIDRRLGPVIDALHKALAPQLTFDNVTWNQNPKSLADAHVSISLPWIFSTIYVGIQGVTLTALNVNWSLASAYISTFQTAMDALRASTVNDFQGQQLTLGLHLKPGEKSFRDKLTQFVNPKALGSEDAGFFGVSVYYPGFSFVMDLSGTFPGGIFVKLIRQHEAAKRFDEMAAILRKDEETVLRRLGLRVQ
jgi:hypothetical protein